MDALSELFQGEDPYAWNECVVPDGNDEPLGGGFVERVMALFYSPLKRPTEAETEEEFHTLLNRYVTQVTVRIVRKWMC